jgi:leucyl/phenylalanyl-tRNA--protein transferase
MDRDFSAVIQLCAGPRAGSQGTWLLPEMVDAYCALHVHGLAHSVEVWREGDLVGGLYGVAIGGVFFGESMFSKADNASKVALVHLAEHSRRLGVELIDCQVQTGHMQRMGAEPMPRARFLERLSVLRDRLVPCGSWDDGCFHYPGIAEVDRA